MCSISMYVRLSRQNQRGVTRCKMNGRFIQLWDSNFEPGLCLTRWGAVGDGLIYFSENCHSGIFFGLACAVFLHLFTVVAIMFNLGVFCSDTYKVTLIKIRMFKKLPCLARVFWSFKNCDALICCDPCLPIGSLPLLPHPPLQAKRETNHIFCGGKGKCLHLPKCRVCISESVSGGQQEGERSARQ